MSEIIQKEIFANYCRQKASRYPNYYLLCRLFQHIRIQYFQKVLDPDPEVQNVIFLRKFKSSSIFL
jgi:hypothetical protein